MLGRLAILFGIVLSSAADASNVTASISLLDPPRTNLDRAAFGVTFDGDPTPLDPGHVSLTGSLSDAATFSIETDGPGYRIQVTPVDPDADGSLGIQLDLPCGEDVVSIESEPYTIDNTPPAVAIGPPSSGNADNGPVEFIVTFVDDADEAIAIDLTATDIELVAGGTAWADVSVEGAGPSERRVTLSNMIGDGSLAIRVPAGVARDDAGNLSAVATSDAIVVDNTPLSTVIGAPTPGTTRSGPVTFRVNYLGAASLTLSADDVELESTGEVSAEVSVTGEGLRERTITLDAIAGDGTIVVSLPAGTAVDASGAPLPGAMSSPLTVDNTPPTIMIGPPSSAYANRDPIEFAVAVEGGSAINLSLADVMLSQEDSADADVVIAGSGSQWTVRLENVRGDGAMSIGIVEAAVADSVGNVSSFAGPSEPVIVDTTAPTVTIDQHPGQHDPAHQLPITYEVTFSEAVTGFGADDVLFSGDAEGVAVSVQGDGDEYRVFVTGVSEPGDIELSIDFGAASDAAGNANASSTSVDNVVTYSLAPEPCELTSLRVLTPADGTRVIVGPGRYPVGLHFAAETDCDSRALFVEYSIGGLELGTAFDPPFRVSLDDVFAVLEPGKYTVRASAMDQRSGRIVAETASEFRLERGLSAEDPERDGFPNYPNQSLAEAGDVWLSTARQAPKSGLRTVALQRLPMEAEEEAVALIALSDPEFPDVRTSARVPLAPLAEAPAGLLVMAMAKDPVALFDDSAMDALGFEPPQGLVAGGNYVYLNYLAPGSTDFGFDDPAGAPFAGSPIAIRVDGLPVDQNGLESFYAHPATIAPAENGIWIAPELGDWDKAAFGEMAAGDGTVEGELLRFALLAPFNSPFLLSPALTVRPSTVDFGAVPVYRSAEAEFVIANDGGAVLQGTFTAPSPFEVMAGGDYAIEPGRAHTIRVRFAPNSAREFVKVGRASGGQTRSVTLKGRGTVDDAVPGCAASTGVDSSTSYADGLSMVLVSLVLISGRRRVVETLSGE